MPFERKSSNWETRTVTTDGAVAQMSHADWARITSGVASDSRATR